MEKIVVCDDFVGDPLTDVVADMEVSGELQYMRISDFLEREGFTYDSELADLCQSENSDRNTLETMILDRVIELSPKTVEQIGKAEGLLQRGQILSRYRELLQHYGTPMPDMRYSTVGKLHPLPTQWHIIDEAGLPIKTPTYRYGYGPTPIDTDDLQSPVFKSAFDLYKWKPNEPPEDEQPWDQFAVDVPSGNPILTYFLGADQYIACLREADAEPSDQTRVELLALMSKIRELFGKPQSGEILWYVDDGSYTFAAFSHFLSGASMTPSFAENARRFFDAYFESDDVAATA